MVKSINPYPNKGTNIRQFLKTFKNKPGTKDSMTTADRKSVNEGGLYYLSGDLPKEKREGIPEGFDAQVKIGAAGIRARSDQDEDSSWNAKKTAMARNKLPGRLQMYAGHQGATPWKVQEVRNMAYNKQKKGKGKAYVNKNVDDSERAMKSKMKDVARDHEGVKVTKESYTWNDDKETGESQLTAGVVPEWYLVDWDKRNVPGKNDKNTYTPHQAISQAMASHKMPKGHHSNQFEVNDSKLTPIDANPDYKRASKKAGSANQQKQKMILKGNREKALLALREADDALNKRRHKENVDS